MTIDLKNQYPATSTQCGGPRRTTHLLLSLQLGQHLQLLLPLLAHLGDQRVEQSVLLALLVHLVVGVLKHHLETVVAEDARGALGRGG